jgi:hypothetical protein
MPAMLAYFALLAVRVSYRWFDCFFLLIPFYGIVWAIKIAWRVVNLPRKDGPLREDEGVAPARVTA